MAQSNNAEKNDGPQAREDGRSSPAVGCADSRPWIRKRAAGFERRGKAAHEKGTAHEFTSDEARDAGRKGAHARNVARAGQKQPSDTAPPAVIHSRTRKAACDIEGQRGDVGGPATIGPDESVGLAVERMRAEKARHLPVVQGRSLVGMVSEHEVLASLIEMGSWPGHAAGSRIMTSPVPVIAPDADAREAAAKMAAMKIDCLPVMEGSRLVGIVTVTDLLSRQVLDARSR